MAKVTRSLNPLHFEDLEPRRFEDLVRQLAYDFRPWRSIEALGRTGTDDGLDIRAHEIAGAEAIEEKEETEDEAPPTPIKSGDRQWIIQCKREKRIGPKDTENIVAAALPAKDGVVHGFVLAAACDISKKARETFRDECRKHGVQEVQVWAKGELEDMLFQPKNDHLLFAHFGLSIQVRRRHIKTEVRSNLALKKKLVEAFGAIGQRQHITALVRDPKDESYPWISSPKSFVKKPDWFRLEFHSHQPVNAVSFRIEKYFAYISDDGKQWDALLDCNGALSTFPEVFGIPKGSWHDDEKWFRYSRFWSTLPPRNQAWLEVIAPIPYERILAVDSLGDHYNRGLQLLVDRRPDRMFFEDQRPTWVRNPETFRQVAPIKKNRIKFFPDVIPEPPPIKNDETI